MGAELVVFGSLRWRGSSTAAARRAGTGRRPHAPRERLRLHEHGTARRRRRRLDRESKVWTPAWAGSAGGAASQLSGTVRRVGHRDVGDGSGHDVGGGSYRRSSDCRAPNGVMCNPPCADVGGDLLAARVHPCRASGSRCKLLVPGLRLGPLVWLPLGAPWGDHHQPLPPWSL